MARDAGFWTTVLAESNMCDIPRAKTRRKSNTQCNDSFTPRQALNSDPIQFSLPLSESSIRFSMRMYHIDRSKTVIQSDFRRSKSALSIPIVPIVSDLLGSQNGFPSQKKTTNPDDQKQAGGFLSQDSDYW
jgi:hypothetical protein